MKKIFLIGWKDVTVIFRDRAALTFMLLAPFLLTLGMGFVTGRFSGGTGSSGLEPVQVILVNQDDGELGQALVELFESPDLAELIDAETATDAAQAKTAVDNDEAAAVVIIPAGFTESIIPPAGQTVEEEVVQIDLYANPTRPVGSGIVKTILEQFMAQVEVGRVGGEVLVMQLLKSGLIAPQQAAEVGMAAGAAQAESAATSESITLERSTNTGEEVEFDVLAYMAPGMALMFLMFTVSNGGRTLLSERALGTLPRLMISPTTETQILAGKIFGIFLTGAAQMLILIGASTLFFQVRWGNPLGVLILVLAAVFGAVGWGLLITAMARTPGQVSAVGSALMLTFGILGGSFLNISMMPEWFRLLSKITPNAWGLDGFTILALGGDLGDLVTPVMGLLAMGIILFGIAVFQFNRNKLIQR
jgi:ABC-2 type transport system permease protein